MVSPRSVQANSPRRQRTNSSQTSASSNNNNQVQSFVVPVPNFNFEPQPTSSSAVFQPPTTPLGVNSSRKPKRPRTRRTMNPPPAPLTPPPKFAFPSLPPSPSPTSSLFPGDKDTFKEGIPRKYRTRPHIFESKVIVPFCLVGRVLEYGHSTKSMFKGNRNWRGISC